MRVLIPTDFSDNAENALRYAVQLLADTTCTFYLLHTYTPAVYRSDYLLESPGQIGLGDVLKYQTEKKLDKLVNKIKESYPNAIHQFVKHSAFNVLYYEIDEMVNNENIDLIVMGTQGATGAKEIFLGTHAVHTIKKTVIPLLVIPPGAKYSKPQKILLPTDFEVSLGGRTLELTVNLISQFEAELNVLHVSAQTGLTPAQVKNKSELSEIITPIPHQFHNWPDQDIIGAISEFMEQFPVEILAMVRNKHTFIEKLFIEPVIKKIAFHTDKPFLVLPLND